MEWQQKLAALNALTPHSLLMRKPGDWYVSCGIEIAGTGVLVGAFGNGVDPESAVNDHWRQLIDEIAESGTYLLYRKYGEECAAKWNGFMWVDQSHMRKKTAAA